MALKIRILQKVAYEFVENYIICLVGIGMQVNQNFLGRPTVVLPLIRIVRKNPRVIQPFLPNAHV